MTSTPSLNPTGSNTQINSTTYYGPTGRIQLANLVDAGGVGFDYAQCYWNSNTVPTTYYANALLTPITVSGSNPSFTLRCRIVDQVGNIGNNTTISGIVDLQSPTTTFSPNQGNTITDNTTITFSSNDANRNGTSTATIFWTNGTDNWNTTVSFTGQWTGTLASLNSTLGDGTVTANIVSRDWFGNTQTLTVNSWILNTTMVSTIVSFDYSNGMTNVGQYVGDAVRFTATPPTGGYFTSTFRHSEGSTSGGHNPNYTTDSWGFSGMESGRIWLNVTTTDAYGRTATDVYTYIVDAEVNTIPSILISGDSREIDNYTIVGLRTELKLQSLVDEPGGSGYSHVLCDLGNGVYQNMSASTTFNVEGNLSEMVNKTVSCKIVDLVGNEGEIRSINFTHDGVLPQVSSVLQNNQVLVTGNSIVYNCTDSSGASTKNVEYNIYNSTNSASGTVELNGTQLSFTDLPLNESSNLWILYRCQDYFGNIAELNITGLRYLNDVPYASVDFGSYQFESASGHLYITDSTNLTITYVSNGNGIGYVNSRIEHNGSIIGTWNSSNSSIISFSNYSDGDYNLIMNICSSYFCNNISTPFSVDSTEPGGTINLGLRGDGTTTQMQVVKIGRSSILEVRGGYDNGSGLKQLNCTMLGNTISLNYDGDFDLSPLSLEIFSEGLNSTLSCILVDNLGLESPVQNFSIQTDYTNPFPSLHFNISGVNLFDDTSITGRCNELNNISTANLYITKNGQQIVYSIIENQSTSISDVIQSNSSGSVALRIDCEDEYGNRGVSQNYSMNYIQSLGEIAVDLGSYLNGSEDKYILGQGSTISFSSATQIGELSINAYSGSSIIWTKTYDFRSSVEIDEENVSSIFANLSDGSVIDLHYNQAISNSSVNYSGILMKLMMPQSPALLEDSRSLISNSTLIQFNISGLECSDLNVVYNSTSSPSKKNIATNTSFSIQFPTSTTLYELFTFKISDCLGNQRVQNFTYQRDLLVPQIDITGITNSFVSNQSLISVNISDNSDIIQSIIEVGNSSERTTLCSSICDFFVGQNLNYSHLESGYVKVTVRTSSGELRVLNRSYFYDGIAESANLDVTGSVNYSNYKTGPNTSLKFRFNETMKQVCVEISELLIQSCQDDTSQIIVSLDSNYSDRNITVVVNATDLYENFAAEVFSFSYHSTLPVLITETVILRNPEYVLLNVSSNLEYKVLYLNQNSSNSSIFFSTTGDNNLSLQLVDSVGNLVHEELRVIIDTTTPILTTNLTNYSFAGPNTNIGFGMLETDSMISWYNLTIENNRILCSIEADYVLDYQRSVSYSIASLLNRSDCMISLTGQDLLNITFRVENLAGLISSVSNQLTYYSEVIPATIIGSNFTIVGNNISVSSHSELRCTTAHNIDTTISINYSSGSYQIVDNVTYWGEGSAVLTCYVIDSVGNSWQKTWNLNYVENALDISFTYKNNWGNITQFGSENLNVSASSNDHITSLVLRVNGSVLTQTSSFYLNYQFSNSPGVYNLSATAITELGFTLESTSMFTLDSMPPAIEILEGPLYLFENDTLITRSNQRVIQIMSLDASCERNISLNTINSTITSYDGQNYSITISHNVTEIGINSVDCVGNQFTKYIHLERLDSINIPVYSAFSNITQKNNGYLIGSNFSFTLEINHPLLVNLTCSLLSQEIYCGRISGNSWLVIVSNISSNSVLNMEFSDYLSNNLLSNFSLIVDNVAPVCTLESHVQNLVNYVRDISEVQIYCYDSYGQDVSISHESGLVLNSINNSVWKFDATGIGNHSIIVTDPQNNSLAYEFRIIEDSRAPEVNCNIGERSLSQELINYVNGSLEVNCLITDTTYLSYEYAYEFIENGNVISNETEMSGSAIQLVIPRLNDTDNTLLTLRGSDSLGNNFSTEFMLSYDLISPYSEIIMYNRNSIQIMNSSLIDHVGTIRIASFDNSSVTTSFAMDCGDLVGEGTFNSRTYFIDLQEYDFSVCDDLVDLRISIVDEAKNRYSRILTFRIDREIPIFRFSSNCDLDYTSDIIITHNLCSLIILSTDDTTSHVAINLSHEGNSLQAFGSVNVVLRNLSSDEIINFTVTVTDQVGNSHQEIYRFILQDDYYLEPDSVTCMQQTVFCAPQNYDVDVIIGGLASFNLQFTESSIETNLSNLSGHICNTQNNNCQEVSFPVDLVSYSDGEYIIDYFSRDNLGRISNDSFSMLIDRTRVFIIDEIFEVDGLSLENYSNFRICDNCEYVVTLNETHQPQLYGFGGSFSITELSENVWELRIPLTYENVGTYRNLGLSIYSASGLGFTQVISLESYQEVMQYRLSVDSVPCLDSPESLINQNSDSHICLFSRNSRNSVSLNIEYDNDIQSDYRVQISECFINPSDGCRNYDRLFSQTNSDFSLALPVRSSSTTTPMIYQLSIIDYHSYEAFNLSVRMIDRNDFNSSTRISDIQSFNITQNGSSSLAGEMRVSVNLGQGVDVRNDEYLIMMADALTESVCKLKGTWYTASSPNSSGDGSIQRSPIFEQQELRTDFRDCELEAIIVGNNIYFSHTLLQWSEQPSSQDLSDIANFLLADIHEIEIQYIEPITGKNRSFSLDGNVADLSEDTQPTISQKCLIRISAESKYPDQRNWPEITKCLDEIYDPEGLIYAGFSMVLDGDEDRNIEILCERGAFHNKESTLEDLLSNTNEDNGCFTNNGNLEWIKDQETYNSIEIEVISCDLICWSLDNQSSQVIDTRVSWENSVMFQPRVNTMTIFLSWIIILPVIIGAWILFRNKK